MDNCNERWDALVPGSLAYSEGWRAYETFDGIAVYFKNGLYHHTPLSVQKVAWHALRAYQDEQRKKGVPITFHTTAEEKYWEDLSTTHHRNYTAVNSKPYISMKRGYFDYIVFTNFRWREGYPKGGTHASV